MAPNVHCWWLEAACAPKLRYITRPLLAVRTKVLTMPACPSATSVASVTRWRGVLCQRVWARCTRGANIADRGLILRSTAAGARFQNVRKPESGGAPCRYRSCVLLCRPCAQLELRHSTKAGNAALAEHDVLLEHAILPPPNFKRPRAEHALRSLSGYSWQRGMPTGHGEGACRLKPSKHR